MPAKKMKAISMYLEEDMQAIMERAIQKMGLKSNSELVRKLIKHFALDKDDVKAVVLQVPLELFKDRNALKNWLLDRTEALVSYFCPEIINGTEQKAS